MKAWQRSVYKWKLSKNVQKILISRAIYLSIQTTVIIYFHLNCELPGEYQFVNHVVYVTRRYKCVVIDQQLHKLISHLAINKRSYRSTRICLQLRFSTMLSAEWKNGTMWNNITILRWNYSICCEKSSSANS